MAFFKTRKRKLILSIVILTLIAMFSAPPFLKNYLIKNSKELIGRQVDIESLKYNYFSSTAKVYDFKMYEANQEDIFVSFDTLILNLEPLRYFFGEMNIEQFYVQGLELNIEMKDTVFNFDDLVAYHSAPSDTLITEEKDVFKYSLSNLELKDADLYFDDVSVGKMTKVEDFSFVIPEIYWNQDHKSNADLQFDFKNGGYFESEININPASGDYDLTIEIESLTLNGFYEYLAQYAEINDLNGNLNTSILIKGNTNEIMNSIISGDAEIIDFSMTDKEDKEFLKADTAKVKLHRVDYANNAYSLGKVEFTKPYVYFQMDSISNNFLSIFNTNSDQQAPSLKGEDDSNQTKKATSDTIPSVFYEIDNLVVNQGLMDYTDNLTGTKFEYHLNDIKINTDKIISTSDWINIYADMLLNNRGTLKSSLGINPKSYEDLSLDIVIENFLLSDINVYANYYTGHSIILGDFFYISKSDVTNGNILSENQLLVKNVSVDNIKGGLYTLPLKFALFLLKDKNGDVNLTVPLRGNLNDPEIDVWKMVWTTLKTRITGVAKDPITSIATLVDVDPKDYKALKFGLTDTIISAENTIKLDKLLEMETVKEGLKVELLQQVDTALQMQAIAIEALGLKFNSETKKNYIKNENAFKRYIKRETGNDTLSIEQAALTIVPESELRSLALSYQDKLRTAINQYLVSQKPSTNILAVEAQRQDSIPPSNTNQFEIKFDMLSVLADGPKAKQASAIE